MRVILFAMLKPTAHVQDICSGYKELQLALVGCHGTKRSDRHDKPFCIKALTIVDNFKKALGNTDNR